MRTIAFTSAMAFFVGIGSIAAEAKENCQNFRQDDGSTKVLCQDKKGRWIEQEDSRSVKYHPLQKARVIYEGTMTLDVLVPVDNGRRSKGIGGFLKSMLMQTVSSQSARVRITVDYSGESISATIRDLDANKTYRSSGSRSKKSCRIAGSQLGSMSGGCTEKKFNMTRSAKQRDGSTRRLSFDVRATGYTDLYKAELDKQRNENERQRLQNQCNAGTLEACTTLEEFGGLANENSAGSTTATKTGSLASRFVNLEPNQPAKARGLSRWSQQVAQNYPARAAKEGMSGTVGVLLTVGQNGRVNNCDVSKSSGHTLLDETACRNFMRYGRFVPATDNNADPIVGPFSTKVTYRFN